MTRFAPALILLVASSAPAGELKAGAAAVAITPPAGTPMAGYYSMRAAEGVHDDLYAKALVIEADGRRAALVALDLISTTRELVEEARRQIAKTTGVPGDAVMISATHAHTGPVLRSGTARDAMMGADSDLSRRFNIELPGKIAEAVRLAESKLAPATVSVAHGRESSIAFNRRYHMKDGTVGWNPGKLNPKILKPAGTIDPDVPVVYVEATDRKPIATYVNYAVHLDNVGGARLSADMPATLARCLADFKGPGMVTLFTAGCCGDINHIDVNWAERQGGFENAARMGVILSGEVLRSWPRLERVKDGGLRTRSATVKLDLAPIGPEDVAKARAVVARLDAKSGKPTFLETVKAFQVLDVEARAGRPIEVEVQVIALGDEVAWVSLPGEIFVELGLAIKQDSPFKNTIIAELANGAIGYIPSRRAYAQGNYEVVSARCAEGSGERLVDAAVGLLEALHREATAGPRPNSP
jgi:hypothetical protein